MVGVASIRPVVAVAILAARILRGQAVVVIVAIVAHGIAAVVVRDASGGPGTLRLSLTPEGDEVVVARAVQRILKLQFGVGLDPGRIEVVEESLPEPPTVPAPRLRVVDESSDGSLELTVRGQAEGLYTAPRFVAKDALGNLLGERVRVIKPKPFHPDFLLKNA